MVTKLVKGNTAVTVGALYAGCDCFFGYPITPASEILHEASHYFPHLGRKFVQRRARRPSTRSMGLPVPATGRDCLPDPALASCRRVSYLWGRAASGYRGHLSGRMAETAVGTGDYNQVVKGVATATTGLRCWSRTASGDVRYDHGGLRRGQPNTPVCKATVSSAR